LVKRSRAPGPVGPGRYGSVPGPDRYRFRNLPVPVTRVRGPRAPRFRSEPVYPPFYPR
jgi:hypothetical protein